jgi:hypothetical protein
METRELAAELTLPRVAVLTFSIATWLRAQKPREETRAIKDQQLLPRLTRVERVPQRSSRESHAGDQNQHGMVRPANACSDRRSGRRIDMIAGLPKRTHIGR